MPPTGVGKGRLFSEFAHSMPTSSARASRWARPAFEVEAVAA
jgi:hypothetical protein